MSINRFDGVVDWKESPSTVIETWKIIFLLLSGVILLLIVGAIISLIHGIPPTMYHLLNSNIVTVPFAVTAINLLQLAHMVISLSIYCRTKDRAPMLASIQLVFSSLTHGSLLTVLGLLPFFGWSQDWASPVAIFMWSLWEFTVVLALRKIYKSRPAPELRFLKLNVIVYIFYTIGALCYIALRIVPLSLIPNRDLFLIFDECVLGICALLFVALLLFHTKEIVFSVTSRATIVVI